MSGEDQDDPTAQRPWFLRLPRRWVQRAVLRVLLLEALVVPALALLDAPRDTVVLAALLPLLGLPGVAVEALVEDRFPTRRLVIEASLVAVVTTVLLAALVRLQAAYVRGVIDAGPGGGVAGVAPLLRDPLALAGEAVTLGMWWALTVTYRLRFGGLPRQTAVLTLEALGVTVVLVVGAGVGAALRLPAAGECALLVASFSGWAPALTGALLVTFRLVDRLDRRLRGLPAS